MNKAKKLIGLLLTSTLCMLVTPTIMTLSSCSTSNSNSDSQTPIEIKSVSLSEEELVLKPNETRQLTVNVEPKNATIKTINWSSKSEVIATVDNGNVTAKNGGQTIIKATINDKFTVQCTVSVVFLVNNLKPNSSENVKLTKGQSTVLGVQVIPLKATNKSLDWSASSDDVVQIEQHEDKTINGQAISSVQIIAIKPGSATITAKTKDGSNISVVFNVEVTEN